MKLHGLYSYTSLTFFIISVTLQAQSISINDDRKRFILDEIKPPQLKTNPQLRNDKSEKKSVITDDLLGISKKYRSGGAEFDTKYDTILIESTIKNIDLTKNDSCTQINTIINNGKIYYVPKKEYEYQLDKLSQRHRLQGVMINITIGGFNLSGWKKKKLSKKTKSILQNTYGIEIEED